MIQDVFGANQHFLYTPTTEDEQEALMRMVETDDLIVQASANGIHPMTVKVHSVTLGDKRFALSLEFEVLPFETNGAVATQVDLVYIHLSLVTRAGRLLHEKKEPVTLTEGGSVAVPVSVPFDAKFDVSIGYMNPEFVRHYLPNRVGMTTRRLDRDTGVATLLGNLKSVNEHTARLLEYSLRSDRKVREDVARRDARLTRSKPRR